MSYFNNVRNRIGRFISDNIPSFRRQTTDRYENTAKKIEECFHDAVIQNMYSMTTNGDEQRRFKQAVIHVICTNPNIDAKELPRRVSRLYHSKEDIPSHDDIVSIDKVQYECNKIKKCFSDVGIRNMYSMITKEGKQRRFKQALIHAIYMDPSIDVGKDLPKAVLRLYHSKEDIPSHDDIVTVESIQDATDVVDSHVPQTVEGQGVLNPMVYKTQTGLVLVLYNDFDGVDGMDRLGRGQRDNDVITALFEKFNIHAIEGGGNLKNREEFNSLMNRAINQINEEKPDVFICVISTHGGESAEADVKQKSKEKSSHVVKHQFVLGDETPIFTNELTAQFNNNKCQGLKGKPRLFFIQACRSREGVDEFDYGLEENSNEQLDDPRKHELPDASPPKKNELPGGPKKDKLPNRKHELPDAVPPKNELPGKPKKHELPDAKPHRKVELPTKPPGTKTGKTDSIRENKEPVYYEVTEDICYEDCLVMFSSPPGRVAWGNADSTSWLIDCLAVAFDSWEKYPELELMEVLNIAAQDMSEMAATNKEYKSVPSLQHKLTKEIRLKAEL